MAVLIEAALVSTAGWMISLAFPSSAARRHLILSTALAACLLLPVAAGVRSGTDWTLVAISRSAAESESIPPGTFAQEQSTGQRLHERTDNGNAAAANPRPVSNGEFLRDSTNNDVPQHSSLQQEETTAENEARSPIGTSRSEQAGSAGSATWSAATHWATVAYALIAGLLLLRLFASLTAVWRLKRRATLVETLPTGIRVLEADVAVPLAAGFGRPAIILPLGFRSSLEPGALQDVLAHEAEHLRRGDHWIMLLQRIAAAIYWPVVTVHLLNRTLLRAREELCDNAVLALRDPAAYGQTLLLVANQVSARREFCAQLAPSVVWRGDLERRIAGLLDKRRDRRTGVSGRTRWTATAGLLALATLTATTRIVANEPPIGEAEATARDVAPSAPPTIPAPKADIHWTDVPKVDPERPTLHRGVVLSPDGKPLADASIYAASTIELLELADVEEVDASDLGPVRAVTDEQGRFEFTAEDLSWVTPAGERKRWETLLVATKAGTVPGWLKTWGEDRSFREHWHPHISREVAVPIRPPATLTGRLLLAGGEPLANAHVRLTGLMAPRHYDLDRHISEEEVNPIGFLSTIDYQETLYRPWVLPGLKHETTTNEEGRFELPGLPEGFIAQIEVIHPQAETTSFRVAVRPIDPVYRKQPAWAEADVANKREPMPTLYGSGFTRELPRGAVLRGRVTIGNFLGPDPPVAGVIVALANHNAKDGMSGQRFKTDADGRFEVTGLRHNPQGYELAFAGSFAAPAASRRKQVIPGVEADVELSPAVPYRLKLMDPYGKPLDRTVYSIQVQETPGRTRNDIKRRFNDAERVAPGLYEGIVPTGPGAVVVTRKKADRPAAVLPKAFFEPGRTDWTPEEKRFAYGDTWRIARPGVVVTERLSVARNQTLDQLDLAAVVFTNATDEDGVLELTATVHPAPPPEVTLVDESGKLVAGASVTRQLERYNAKDLPATFPVYGLHPERAEFFVFQHEKRGLIGTLRANWSSDPLHVVLRPAATLIGRFTDATGKPNHDFRIRVLSEGVLPDTYVGARRHNTTDVPGEREGEFRLMVPPGVEVRGEFVRSTAHVETRPSAGTAFGPLTPKPGETVELGDLVVP